MDHYRQEMLATCIAEIIGVVDATTTIMFRIDEDDDMFIRRTCEDVVETFQV